MGSVPVDDWRANHVLLGNEFDEHGQYHDAVNYAADVYHEAGRLDVRILSARTLGFELDVRWTPHDECSSDSSIWSDRSSTDNDIPD
jgi:hypothetical protein